jgi:hypothetical protein
MLKTKEMGVDAETRDIREREKKAQIVIKSDALLNKQKGGSIYI